jgi:hypothetical protein
MQFPHMLIDRGGCLCATVAFSVVEIKGVNSEFADCAFEGDAAIQRLSGVITHN